jgi:hypothetical protein
VVAVVGVCVALSALSLLVPAAVTYDAWAWLTWGREVAHLDLVTAGGPSWKPLPVMVTMVLSLFGDAAPALWLVVARTGALLALAAAFVLGRRLAGRVAGALAAVLLVLTPDREARFTRLLAEGHTGPLEAALFLWAIERLLAGRHTAAWWLGVALALLRPEAWPFLLVYGVWLWRHDPARRRIIGATAILVPVLWFGGDAWGSGDPLRGADLAQVAEGDGQVRLEYAAKRVARCVIAPVWVLAGFAVVAAWRRRDRVPALLAGLAGGWALIVVAMSVVLRYAALSRFLLPVAALACVLAGAGAVWAVRSVPMSWRPLAMAALGLVLVGFSAPRVGGLGETLAYGSDRVYFEHDIDTAITDAGGPQALRACGGRVAVDHSGQANAIRTALAWKLDLPLSAVTGAPATATPAAEVTRRGTARHRQLERLRDQEARPLGESEEWVIYGLGCAPSPS